MGGNTLDGMAADNPTLVEYFFGGGGQRLMADALQGGRDISQGVPGEDLLEAIVARQRSLATAEDKPDARQAMIGSRRTGPPISVNHTPSPSSRRATFPLAARPQAEGHSGGDFTRGRRAVKS
ncbi:hypothetical protein ABT061_14095 [Streptosporangium sp. NPDC002544]|uniref:hypothetical protein n=1 Tax=Streptosporangium sp. NPDC002544 TaxID=3154538 RepID=UPI00331A2DD8